MKKCGVLLFLIGAIFLGIFVCSGITHADSYWVGNTGNFTDAANHWSNVSGGTPNVSFLPNSNVDVWFDVNSFNTSGQVVTLDAHVGVKNMSWVGVLYNPTLAGTKNLNFYCNAIFSPNMTTTHTGNFVALGNTTIMTNGLTLASPLGFGGNTNCSLLDKFTSINSIRMTSSRLITNNFNISCVSISDEGTADAKTVTLGSSIVTCSVWTFYGSGNLTLTPNTATIKVSGTGNFYGGNASYYNVQLNGTAHTIKGNNSFNNLTLLNTNTQTITFTDGDTQTVTTASLNGSASKIHTLKGSSTLGWNITKSGGGILEYTFMNISYSNAAPASTFYYYGSTVSNNTGWTEKAFSPTAQTNAATSAEETTASLNGQSIDSGNESCQYQFFYGDTIAYTNSTTRTGSINDSDTFLSGISGLTQGKTYHFMASLNNSAGVGNGSDLTFITKPEAPSLLVANTYNCSRITLAWAKGTGALNTSVIRKIGSYPANISDGTQVYFGSGITYNDSGLARNTSYYYRAWSQAVEEGLTAYSDGNSSDYDTTTKCWYLTITGSPVGGGTPIYTETMPVENGSPTHIYAGLNPLWYTFVEWTPHTDIAAPLSANTTITMTANRSITATYLLQLLPQPARQLGNMTGTIVSLLICALLIILLLGFASKEVQTNGINNAVIIAMTGIVGIIIIETIMVAFFKI